MSFPVKMLRPLAALVAGAKAPMDRHWQEWLRSLLADLHKSVTPPKAVVTCNLSASDISDNFDATGLGNTGGPYEWWAICNGNNSTPDLSGLFVRHSSTASGGTGGSLTTDINDITVTVSSGAGEIAADDGHTHTFEPPYYELVYLMRTGS